VTNACAMGWRNSPLRRASVGSQARCIAIGDPVRARLGTLGGTLQRSLGVVGTGASPTAGACTDAQFVRDPISVIARPDAQRRSAPRATKQSRPWESDVPCLARSSALGLPARQIGFVFTPPQGTLFPPNSFFQRDLSTIPSCGELGSFCTFHPRSDQCRKRQPPLPTYPSLPKFGFVLDNSLRQPPAAGRNVVPFARFDLQIGFVLHDLPSGVCRLVTGGGPMIEPGRVPRRAQHTHPPVAPKR
jgi:hypothetical protein